jgi:molybdate transport system ATP-binding protein
VASDGALEVDVSYRVADFELEAKLEVPRGVTILFGPSGAGKTTILSLVAGLLRPRSGRIAVGGNLWFDANARVDVAVEARGLAFVFQSLSLFPHMTAAANVEYGVDRALPAPERRRRAHAMLERMRVAELADRRPRTFSGGEAQRVALARAFARAPRVVLLDEPFSALDRELRRELAADVKAAVADLGVPAILVTHHREDARALGERIVCVDRGRITAQGKLDEHLGELA